jgi:hypothetical protein
MWRIPRHFERIKTHHDEMWRNFVLMFNQCSRLIVDPLRSILHNIFIKFLNLTCIGLLENFKEKMLQNVTSFYFWNQKLCLKIKSYFDQIWEKKTVLTPCTLANVVPCSRPNDVEILKEYSTPFKLKMFEVWNKSNGEYKRNNYFSKESRSLFMEIIPWTPLWPLATHNFFPCSFVSTHFLPWTTFLHTFIFLFFQKKTQDKKFFSFTLSMTLPWACSPCPMEVMEILPSNQWPSHPSWINENREWFNFLMKFRMKILMPNETLKGFHFLIK